jgi:uncharacterized protein
MTVTHHFYELAFTPSVQREQARRGSRAVYATLAARSATSDLADELDDKERAFIEARDSFYLATVTETGWPYVQHRGGPAGFARCLDESTIGWAEYPGNRQYITTGNLSVDDRAALILVDYPHRQRLKVLGRIRVYDRGTRPDLEPLLFSDRAPGRVEQFILITVEAADWNCPKYITQRYTRTEVEALQAPLQARIAELEEQLRTRNLPAAFEPPGSAPSE